MTDCPDGVIRDLLPQRVHGTLAAADAALVAQHLSSCAECRDEAALLEHVRDALAYGVPRVDVAATVAALPTPRKDAPKTAEPRWLVSRSWQYAAAAGLVLAVGGGIVWRRSPASEQVLVADSLGVVARPAKSTDAPAGTSARLEDGITFGGGLSDLSLNDLQALLGQIDSVRTLPSTDPESMTPVIALKEGGKTS